MPPPESCASAGHRTQSLLRRPGYDPSTAAPEVLSAGCATDLELRMTGTGVQVGDNVVVPWAHLTSTFTQEGRADLAALTDPDIDSGAARSARLRLSAHLHLAPMLEIRLHTRLLALPSDHILHPGPSWVRQPVLGGAVETGLGVVDLVPGRDDIVPLPAPLTDDLEAADWWTRVVAHAHRMGELVVQRLTRDTDFGRASMWINPESGALPSGVLRPVGGVDVVSLLATPALRQHLAGSDSSGMRAVAVPMRDRGWYDLTHTDPAFIGAA
ncbi:MAG: hypothetical protein CSB46_01125 [Micrococcales bacterium]|nr:MAG: hypothetical protein CSB46_01125 [Micrococcales bacterium]